MFSFPKPTISSKTDKQNGQPAVENPDKYRLVYAGFNLVHLPKRFTIQLLNKSLDLSPGIVLDNFEQIETGIVASNKAIAEFSNLSKIDLEASKEIIASWSDFLKNNYAYLNVQACLKRKADKYPNYPAYAIVKNNDTFLEPPTSLYQSVDKFIKNGDTSGTEFVKKIEIPEEKKIALETFDNLIFRRISKLGVLWSQRNSIPLDFYTSVNLEKKSKNRYQSDYQRITYSEFSFIQKQMKLDKHSSQQFSIKDPREALAQMELLPISSILEILGINMKHFINSKDHSLIQPLREMLSNNKHQIVTRAEVFFEVLMQALSSLDMKPESFFKSIVKVKKNEKDLNSFGFSLKKIPIDIATNCTVIEPLSTPVAKKTLEELAQSMRTLDLEKISIGTTVPEKTTEVLAQSIAGYVENASIGTAEDELTSGSVQPKTLEKSIALTNHVITHKR